MPFPNGIWFSHYLQLCLRIFYGISSNGCVEVIHRLRLVTFIVLGHILYLEFDFELCGGLLMYDWPLIRDYSTEDSWQWKGVDDVKKCHWPRKLSNMIRKEDKMMEKNDFFLLKKEKTCLIILLSHVLKVQ